MMNERKAEPLEDERKKWKIYFDVNSDPPRNDMSIMVKFTINHPEYPYLTEIDIKELKQDLENLGKFRIIKEGKNFLEK